MEGETLTPARPQSATPFSFLAVGLFSDTNLPMVTNDNSSIRVNNDASGEVSQFAIFRGDGETPVLEIADDVEGNSQMTMNGHFVVQQGAKDVRIRHPTKDDKWLNHRAVESSEVLKTYSGSVTLGEYGTAVVEMPEWFGPVNKDPRYDLTPVGAPAPRLHGADPLLDGRFKVGGGSRAWAFPGR